MLACCRGSGISDKSADEEGFSVETRNFAPKHLLIKIESFSSLGWNGVEKYYESREFVAGDHKWKLTIHPDVQDIRRPFTDSMVSVYLSSSVETTLPVGWEVNAMFTFFLFNQIQDNYVSFRGKKMWRFHAMNPKWGFSKLMSNQSLTDPSNGYLLHNKLVFGAEVYVIKSPPVIEHVSFPRNAQCKVQVLVISHFSRLGHVWNSEEFTAGDHHWKVMLYPNGNGSAKCRGVSLYIEYVDCGRHEKVMARICMRIKNKTESLSHTKNFSEWFSSTQRNMGFPEFMSVADLQDPEKGYVVDDSCSLEIGISILALVRDAPN
ncbi:hypothetical protein ACS0TY_020940 [Phlomoides rotata]